VVCARSIVHADDHLHIPPPGGDVDIHRLCVPDWAGYEAAVSALRGLGAPTAETLRLVRTLQDCREIPPVP
jgi:hypothetical protein